MGFARLMMLALLVFSGFVVWNTLGSTPAFNPRLVADTIVGEGRIGLSRMMYDKGQYDFQRGYGFLNADRVISALTGAPEQPASPGAVRFRAYEARDALTSAVERDPGNAHAWADLAWAHAQLGEMSNAAVALRISWQIAPYNATLARTRLGLVGLMTDPDLELRLWVEEDLDAILRDIDTLNAFAERDLEIYRERFPQLFSS